jgi:serine/threonine-protein kinase
MIGKTLSHYKVIEKIGQGGMGEVYRAEDTNLSREVAIKVLPEQFTKDPQRLARFEREAKLLASLNHPNIAAIYGLEKADGVRFLALELVEGETLAERVAKGPVPVEETLEICRQIAEGVEAAHEKGVIHRDLKPANVKVTPEGKVKILDFGLAKAFEGQVPIADISQSPTLTEEMTRAGVIMGTAAYMSPEQAKGKVVDKRADIFAFGAILYELLTGRRAFEGETITETLGAIIHKEPDWATLPENTPSIIQVLLRQCLQKNPDSRLRDIADFQALSDSTLAPVEPISAAQTVQQRWGMTVSLVLLTAIVVGVAVWLLIQPSALEQRLNKFVITPASDAPVRIASSNALAISPDGRHFVYTASTTRGSQLYLRSLDDFVDRPIPGTEGAVGDPFFSPDGESVGFFEGGNLKKVSISGGSPITLCQANSPGRGGSWGLDDTIVFTAGAEGAPGLYRVPAAGGEPEFLGNGNPGPEQGGYNSSHLLPDGKSVLVSLYLPPTDYRVELVSLDTREPKIILEHAKDAKYLKTGHLVYEQAGTGNLMAVLFDPTALEVTSDPVPVVQGVSGIIPGAVDYAVSQNGTLLYVPSGGVTSHEHTLVWVDRQGTETLATQEKRSFAVPRISPDGKQVALAIGDDTGRRVSILDFETGALSRFTFEDEMSALPTWSPDGKWLIFQSGKVGSETGMVKQPIDRSRPQERLTSSTARQMPTSWSPDGQVVAFTESSRPGSWDIGILPLEGDGEPQFIISSGASECCPKFSPDGKWLAYLSNELGRNNVYISPYPEAEVKWLASEEEEGGEQPVWSPDGKELYYRSGNRMMVVSIQTGDQTLNVGKPEVLFQGSYVNHSNPPGLQYYDISPDGQRFLMMKEETVQETGQINVVLNWFEELKRLVPTN